MIVFFILIIYNCSGENSLRNKSLNTPQLHFSTNATEGFSPVALIHKQDGYSLYYQTDRQSDKKGRNVLCTFSKDLIHWNSPIEMKWDLGNAILLYANIIIDKSERSIKNKATQTNLIAFLVVQCKNEQYKFIINRSSDNGKTWQLYTTNVSFPIAIMHNYQPGVVWDKFHSKWIMTLANNDAVEFYSSQNLINWQKESMLPKPKKQELDTWTRTTFFPINDHDWVLLIDQQLENNTDGSVIQYFTGTFDGHEFKTLSAKQHWLDYGKDNRCSVVSCGNQEKDRPVIIGVKSNSCYVNAGNLQVWKESATFPSLISLDTVYTEKMISLKPIESINSLTDRTIEVKGIKVDGNLNVDQKIKFDGTPTKLTIQFETNEMTRLNFPPTFGFYLTNDKKEKLIIGYNTFKRWYYIDRSNFAIAKENPQFGGIQYMPCYHTESTMTMTVILDNNSVELFTEKGNLVMTVNFLPQQRFNHLSLFTESGFIKIKGLAIKSLHHI
jgi:Beta-fructosidases (levanase/invertase)